MKVSATAKFVGTSARKTGLVAQLIRGKRATDAVRILQFTQTRATEPVGKVLLSAIANAENNNNLKAKDLVIESVLIGPSRSLKRSMPRAKGSSSPILKRSSHITVILNDGTPAVAAKAASKVKEAKVVEAKHESPKAEAKPDVKAKNEETI
jgi:large subunit ribosomal protein L22